MDLDKMDDDGERDEPVASSAAVETSQKDDKQESMTQTKTQGQDMPVEFNPKDKLSDAEMKVLIEEVQKRHEALFGDYKPGESPKCRWLVWQEVAEKVNEVNPDVYRNLEKVRVAWFEYKTPKSKWFNKDGKVKPPTGMFTKGIFDKRMRTELMKDKQMESTRGSGTADSGNSGKMTGRSSVEMQKENSPPKKPTASTSAGGNQVRTYSGPRKGRPANWTKKEVEAVLSLNNEIRQSISIRYLTSLVNRMKRREQAKEASKTKKDQESRGAESNDGSNSHEGPSTNDPPYLNMMLDAVNKKITAAKKRGSSLPQIATNQESPLAKRQRVGEEASTSSTTDQDNDVEVTFLQESSGTQTNQFSPPKISGVIQPINIKKLMPGDPDASVSVQEIKRRPPSTSAMQPVKTKPGSQLSSIMAQHPGSKLVKLPNGAIGIVIARGNIGDKVVLGDGMILKDLTTSTSAPKTTEITTKVPRNQDKPEQLRESTSTSSKTGAAVKDVQSPTSMKTLDEGANNGYPDTLIVRDPKTGKKVALARVKDPLAFKKKLTPLWPSPGAPESFGLKNITAPLKPIPILPKPDGVKVKSPSVLSPAVHKPPNLTSNSVIPVENNPGMISYKKVPVSPAVPKVLPTEKANVGGYLNAFVPDVEQDGAMMLDSVSASDENGISPPAKINLPVMKKGSQKTLENSNVAMKKGLPSSDGAPDLVPCTSFRKGPVPVSKGVIADGGALLKVLQSATNPNAQIPSSSSNDKVFINTISTKPSPNKTDTQASPMIISKRALERIDKEGTVIIKHPLTGKDVVIAKVLKSPPFAGNAIRLKGKNIPTNSSCILTSSVALVVNSGTENTKDATGQGRVLNESAKAAKPANFPTFLGADTTSKPVVKRNLTPLEPFIEKQDTMDAVPSNPSEKSGQVEETPLQQVTSKECRDNLKRTARMPNIPSKFRVINDRPVAASSAREGDQLKLTRRRKQSIHATRELKVAQVELNPSVRLERNLWLDKLMSDMKVTGKRSRNTSKKVDKVKKIIVRPCGPSYVVCIDDTKAGIIHSAGHFKAKQVSIRKDVNVSPNLPKGAGKQSVVTQFQPQTTGTVKKTQSMARSIADSNTSGTNSKTSSPIAKKTTPKVEKPFDIAESSITDEDNYVEEVDIDQLRNDLKKPISNQGEGMAALVSMMTPGRDQLTRKDIKIMEEMHGTTAVKQYRNLTPISRAGAITERCARTGFISDMDLDVLRRAFNEFLPRIKLALTKSKEYSSMVEKGDITEALSKEINLFNDAVDEVIIKYEMMQRYLSRVVAISEQENKSGAKWSKVTSKIGKHIIVHNAAKTGMELSLMLDDFDHLASDLINAKVEIPTPKASSVVKETPTLCTEAQTVGRSPEQAWKKPISPSTTAPIVGTSPEEATTKAISPNTSAPKVCKSPEQAAMKPISPNTTALKAGTSPEKATIKVVSPNSTAPKFGQAPEQARIKVVSPKTTSPKGSKAVDQGAMKPISPNATASKVVKALELATVKVVSPNSTASKVGQAPEHATIKVVSPITKSPKGGTSPEKATIKAVALNTTPPKVGTSPEKATIKAESPNTRAPKVGTSPEKATIKAESPNTRASKVGTSPEKATIKAVSPNATAPKVVKSLEQAFIITLEGTIVPKSTNYKDLIPATKDNPLCGPNFATSKPGPTTTNSILRNTQPTTVVQLNHQDKPLDVSKCADSKSGSSTANLMQKNTQTSPTIKPNSVKCSDLKELSNNAESGSEKNTCEVKVTSPKVPLLKVRQDLGQDGASTLMTSEDDLSSPKIIEIEDEHMASKVRVTYSRDGKLPTKIFNSIPAQTSCLGKNYTFASQITSVDTNKSPSINSASITQHHGIQLVDISDTSSIQGDEDEVTILNEERSWEKGLKELSAVTKVRSPEKTIPKPAVSPTKPTKMTSPIKVVSGSAGKRDLHPLVAAALSGQPSDFKKLLKLDAGTADLKKSPGPNDDSPKGSNGGTSNETANAKDCGTSSAVVIESKRTASPTDDAEFAGDGAKVYITGTTSKRSPVDNVSAPQTTNKSAKDAVVTADVGCTFSEAKTVSTEQQVSPSALVTSPVSINTRILKVVLPSVDADGKKWELQPNSLTENNLRKSLSAILGRLGDGVDNTKICFVQHCAPQALNSPTVETPVIDGESKTTDTVNVQRNNMQDASVDPAVVSTAVEKDAVTEDVVTASENSVPKASVEPASVNTVVKKEAVTEGAVTSSENSAPETSLAQAVVNTIVKKDTEAENVPENSVPEVSVASASVNTVVKKDAITEDAVTVPDNTKPEASLAPAVMNTVLKKDTGAEDAVSVPENSAQETSLAPVVVNTVVKEDTGAEDAVAVPENSAPEVSIAQAVVSTAVEKDTVTEDAVTSSENSAPKASVAPTVVNTVVKKDTVTKDAVSVPEVSVAPELVYTVVKEDTGAEDAVSVPENSTPETSLAPIVVNTVVKEDTVTEDAVSVPGVSVAPAVVNTVVKEDTGAEDAVSVQENSTPEVSVAPAVVNTVVKKDTVTKDAVSVPEVSVAPAAVNTVVKKDAVTEDAVTVPENSALETSAAPEVVNTVVKKDAVTEDAITAPENTKPEASISKTPANYKAEEGLRPEDTANVLESSVPLASARPTVITVDLEDESKMDIVVNLAEDGERQTLKPPTVITLDLDDEAKTDCLVNLMEDGVPQTLTTPTIVTLDLEDEPPTMPGGILPKASQTPTVITLDVEEESPLKDAVPENSVPQDSTSQTVKFPNVEGVATAEDDVKVPELAEKMDIFTAAQKPVVENASNHAELVKRVESCSTIVGEVAEQVSLEEGRRNDDSIVVGDGLMGHVVVTDGVEQVCDSFVVKSEPNCEFEYIQDWEDCVIIEEVVTHTGMDDVCMIDANESVL